MNHPDTSMY